MSAVQLSHDQADAYCELNGFVCKGIRNIEAAQQESPERLGNLYLILAKVGKQEIVQLGMVSQFIEHASSNLVAELVHVGAEYFAFDLCTGGENFEKFLPLLDSIQRADLKMIQQSLNQMRRIQPISL